MLQIAIAQVMWRIIPIFGRGISSYAVRKHISSTAIFLGGFSLLRLGGAMIQILKGQAVESTLVGRSIITLMSSFGLQGDFIPYFTKWMIIASFIAKGIKTTIMISMMPIFMAMLFVVFKSLNLSTYYLLECWKLLPTFVQNYFIELNSEIYNIYHTWIGPVKSGTEKTLLYISIWKIILYSAHEVYNSAWFTMLYLTHIVPMIGWITPTLNYLHLNPFLVDFLNTLNSLSVLLGGAILSFAPAFVVEFVIWMFSPREMIFNRDWYNTLKGWIVAWWSR